MSEKLKIHHIHDRSIEHAKTRDTMAHKLVTPNAPDGLRSTRGHAVTKGSLPAVDIQPRHGGKPKGGIVEHSWGNTEQQITQDGTRHLIEGAPDASSASPLDTLSTSQYGKRRAPTMVHSGMTRQQIEGATFNGADILTEAVPSGATKLPATVTEEDCDNG